MKSLLITGPVVLCTLFSVSTFAEDLSNPDLTITKKFKQSLAESIGLIRSITKAEIQSSAATSLNDILKSVPGIAVYRKGGDASLSQLRIRGFEDEQVLIYVDGVIVNDVFFGTHRLEFVDIKNIEQIDIVQGPAALSYGSGAAAGVISITTSSAQSTSTEIASEVAYGRYETQELTASLSHPISEDLTLSLKAARSESEGYDVRKDTDPDIDGWDKSSYASSLRKTFGKTNLTVSHSRQEGYLMIDGDSADQNEIEHSIDNKSLSVVSTLSLGTIEFAHGVSQVDERAYEIGNQSNKNIYKTDSKNISVFLTPALEATDHVITLGVDHTRGERAASFSGAGPFYNFAENTGFIISGKSSTPFGILSQSALTLRHDDNKDWGNHTSVATSFSGVNRHNGNTTVTLGSTYRSPTFAEYLAERGERTNQIQIDYLQPILGASSLELAITKALTPNKLLQGNGSAGEPQGENRINYLSTTLSTTFRSIDVSLTYEYTDSRLKEKNWTRMPFVPDHKVLAEATYSGTLGTSKIELNANSGFFTDYLEPSDSRQPGTTDINLAHVLRLGSQWETKLSLENLLDRSVEYTFASTTQQRFELPGRNFMITLQGKF